ncbi:putative serine threonine protein kinase [Rosellinia necatrix]|uniref:Putative serine threonine protein kinase n=1 Tax=Rosellinia necatrix TaxID=77044 RepID=A0A1S7UIQ9_ROSNE|nr:putative serine threonine protein kinase [Rosellinia necatrix]
MGASSLSPAIPVEHDSISAGQPASPNADSSELTPAAMAVTNYGSQIKFNYGTISNYFYNHGHDAHNSAFPSSLAFLPSQLHTKLQTGCALYKSKRYIEAKVIFYEVLQTKDSDLSVGALDVIKYDLARVHFALSEYSEVAHHFKDVMDSQHEDTVQDEDKVNVNLRDSRMWLARSLFHMGKYDDTSAQLKLFIRIAQDKLDTQQITKARMWLGLTFERQRLYELAQEQLEMAHSDLVRALGPEHLEALASRHHLANFFYKQKSFLNALNHFEELLQIEEQMNGPEKSEAIKTRCMVALCLGQLGRLPEAEPHLQQLIPRIELDPNLKSDMLEGIGLMYLWLGSIIMRQMNPQSVGEATPLLYKALSHLSANKDLHGELVECRTALAEVLNFQGHFSRAEHIIRPVLQTVDTARRGGLLASYCALAHALCSQGKMAEAQRTLEDALFVREALIPDRDASQDIKRWLDCLQLLGNVYQKLKYLDRACCCFQMVVDKTLMEPNELSIASRVCLGSVSLELQNFQIAREHLQDARQLLSCLSSHHLNPTRTEVDAMLGWALCALKLFNEAHLSG